MIEIRRHLKLFIFPKKSTFALIVFEIRPEKYTCPLKYCVILKECAKRCQIKAPRKRPTHFFYQILPFSNHCQTLGFYFYAAQKSKGFSSESNETSQRYVETDDRFLYKKDRNNVPVSFTTITRRPFKESHLEE